jgi:hypothetical protein
VQERQVFPKDVQRKRRDLQSIHIGGISRVSSKKKKKGFAEELHKKRMDFQDICIVEKGLPELHRRGWICKIPNIRRGISRMSSKKRTDLQGPA